MGRYNGVTLPWPGRSGQVGGGVGRQKEQLETRKGLLGCHLHPSRRPRQGQGPQMVLGAPGGPCGLRRICVRWLCDEISAQSPSEFLW